MLKVWAWMVLQERAKEEGFIAAIARALIAGRLAK